MRGGWMVGAWAMSGALACSEHALETAQRAILDGYAVDGKTAVVGMASMSYSGFGVCSGSLIAPNLVLTARHCVAPVENDSQGGVQCGVTTFGETHPAEFLFVTTDSKIGQWGNWTSGAEVLLPDEEIDFCGRDIALVLLNEPIPLGADELLVPRVDEPVVAEYPWLYAAGEEYSAIGYGEDGDGQGNSGRRRRLDGLYATCTTDGCPGYPVATSEWVGDHGVCQGDSGGPAVDLQGRVIGVASRGGAGCTYPIYSGVAPWGAWIKETAVYAAEQGGFGAPGWATGAPTDLGYTYPAGDACTVPSDCPGDLCFEGYCTRRCNDDAPCPSAFVCDADGLCHGAPVGAPCADAAACPGGTCAPEGFCTRACGDGLGCPYPTACLEGTCQLLPVGAPCAEDAACTPGQCYQGICTRTCSATAPCPVPTTCDATLAVCIEVPMGDACQTDAECASGHCAQGVCSRACAEDAHCEDGTVCTDAWCVPPPAGAGTEPAGADASAPPAESGPSDPVPPLARAGCEGARPRLPWVTVALLLLWSSRSRHPSPRRMMAVPHGQTAIRGYSDEKRSATGVPGARDRVRDRLRLRI